MRYSIILPVRNGGHFVKECIQSILSQSFPDFELVVLENSSVDDTLAWISSINDRRIKIFPAQQSLSIEENWGRIVTTTKNEFMTITGHDDVLDKRYLETMDDLIKKHPDASLYQAHFRYINAEGKEVRKCLPMAEKQLPADVLHNFLCSKMDIMGTGFMMRSKDYDNIGGIKPYPNLLFADMELWTELSRKSYLAVARQECFSYRIHPASTTSVSNDFKTLKAFDQFVTYLKELKIKDATLNEVIQKDSDVLLRQYCQGITHKVLRTPHKIRQTPSVKEIIDNFRDYGRSLKGNDQFEPMHFTKIRIGRLIDNNSLLHTLFLGFKTFFPKPVLKS